MTHFARTARVSGWIAMAATPSAQAQPRPSPSNFRTRTMDVTAAPLHVRVGGNGPAVVLLHGFGDTGAGHWLMEEAPEATVEAAQDFHRTH